MSRTLEFKEKHEVLELSELQQTLTAKSVGKKRHLEHFDVFNDLSQILSSTGIDHNLQPITVHGGGCASVFPMAEEKFGEKALEAHYLTKVYGEIKIDTHASHDISNLLRVEYSDRGTTVSFGKMVLVCSNGMTAFRGDILSTYGNDKMPYENILEVVKSWMNELEKKSVAYDNLIGHMMRSPIPDGDALAQLIGKLQQRAVAQAYLNGPQAPLNISQVSNFTKNVMTNYDENPEDMQSLWDLYNVATNLQKPTLIDSSTISNTNFAMTNFIMDEYGIDGTR